MKYFLVMFGNEGFECVLDVTEDYPDNFKFTQCEALLSGEAPPKNKSAEIARMMVLRARFNPQRDNECYVIGVSDDLDLTDVKQWTQEYPQQAADFCRERHMYFVFDHRNHSGKRVIA